MYEVVLQFALVPKSPVTAASGCESQAACGRKQSTIAIKLIRECVCVC